MSDELKPCPFCGSEAKLQHDTSSDYERQWTWCVTCQNVDDCWISGNSYATPGEAVAFWNKRPIEDALRERVNHWKEMVALVVQY